MAELYQNCKRDGCTLMSIYLEFGDKVSEGIQAPLSTIVASFSQFSRSFVEVFWCKTAYCPVSWAALPEPWLLVLGDPEDCEGLVRWLALKNSWMIAPLVQCLLLNIKSCCPTISRQLWRRSPSQAQLDAPSSHLPSFSIPFALRILISKPKPRSSKITQTQ